METRQRKLRASVAWNGRFLLPRNVSHIRLDAAEQRLPFLISPALPLNASTIGDCHKLAKHEIQRPRQPVRIEEGDQSACESALYVLWHIILHIAAGGLAHGIQISKVVPGPGTRQFFETPGGLQSGDRAAYSRSGDLPGGLLPFADWLDRRSHCQL